MVFPWLYFVFLCCTEEKSLLRELRNIVPTRCSPGYDPERGCMTGTREEILQDIYNWAQDTGDIPSLLWMHGLAGSGKSAIASTAAQWLDEQKCLGASFFCKRDDPHLQDPRLVLPHIASRLASIFPPFGKRVAAALRDDPHLGTEVIWRQFNGLIKSAVLKLSENVWKRSRPLVVILDALDECGTPETRRPLLSVVCEMSSLVPWLKVIVTSRPEKDIKRVFDIVHHGLRPLNLNEFDPFSDILAFTTQRMEVIRRHSRSLPLVWPGEEKTKIFARCAGHFFVWAQTACTFLEMDPVRRLELVLAGSSHGRSYAALDKLYTIALEDSIPHGVDLDDQLFRNVVGTIVAVATRDPLPVEALAHFLKGDVSLIAINNIIECLGSVLYEDAHHDGAVRICHPSFMDFLMDSKRCPARFFIDLEWHNHNLVRLCLRTMMGGLQFNICGLESSLCFNVDIPDLEARVKRAISSELQYSCIHWPSHLDNVFGKKEDMHLKISGLLKIFFDGAWPLYWLEALSLLGAVQSASHGLLVVIKWLAVSVASRLGLISVRVELTLSERRR